MDQKTEQPGADRAAEALVVELGGTDEITLNRLTDFRQAREADLVVIDYDGQPIVFCQRRITRDRDYYGGDGVWCCSPDPPPGDGWIIADDSNGKRTTWKR